MIKSMTGYGHSRVKNKDASFFIEMRSVNSRYLDVIIKLPENLMEFEDKIKKIVKDSIKRGHINIAIKDESETSSDMELDDTKIKKYINALKSAKSKFKISGEINLDILMRLPQIFTFSGKKENAVKLWSLLKKGLDEAIISLDKSRAGEGRNIYDDFHKNIANMSAAIKKIEEKAPLAVKTQKEKLERNLKEFLPEFNLNHPRVAEELTLFATRVDISEELSRLKSHIESFARALESNNPIGKRLDFIVQEMNRETNTLSSKADNFEVSSQAIIIKEEIEKIREQVQNIE